MGVGCGRGGGGSAGVKGAGDDKLVGELEMVKGEDVNGGNGDGL